VFTLPLLRDVWADALHVLDDYQEEHGDFVLGGLEYSELKQQMPLLLQGMIDGSERIKDIVARLKDYSRQRPDGGWLSPSMVPDGVSLKNTKSGIWTTLFAFQAFSVHSRLRHSDVCHKAAGFVLDNYLERSHTTLFPEADAWSFLHTDYSDNGLFRGGTLRFIEALAPIAEYHNHPNFRKAINWMLDQQLNSGLFPGVVGKSTEGDFAVTLRFVTALREMDKAAV